MVGLIQLTKPARMVYLIGHGPCGCQGLNGFKGSLRGSWLKGSKTSKVLKSFKGSRASGFQGLKGSLRGSVLKRVSNAKGFKSPRASGIQGIKGFRACRETSLVYSQGIKGTIFSLSVLDYAKRYYACT